MQFYLGCFAFCAMLFAAAYFAAYSALKEKKIIKFRKDNGLCLDIDGYICDRDGHRLERWIKEAVDRVPRVMTRKENIYEGVNLARDGRDLEYLKEVSMLCLGCELSELSQSSGLQITFHDKLGEMKDLVIE